MTFSPISTTWGGPCDSCQGSMGCGKHQEVSAIILPGLLPWACALEYPGGPEPILNCQATGENY